MKDKNLHLFQNVLGSRWNNLDKDYIEKRDKQFLSEQAPYTFADWMEDPEKAMVMPDIIPRNYQLYKKYTEMYSKYDLKSGSAAQYINDDENDPHLIKFLCNTYDRIKNLGSDPHNSITVGSNKIDLLVVLDPWDGKALSDLIAFCKPRHLMIVLDKWEDIFLSFDKIDWSEISAEFSDKNQRKLTIARVSSFEEVLSMISAYSLLSFEHAYIFAPPSPISSPANLSIKSKLSSKNAAQIINYLGFAIDEYNMMYSAVNNLSCSSRLIGKLSDVDKISNTPVVIVASGPSLNGSFLELKELEKTHLIVASASSYGPLLENDIRVDLLVILERGYDIYEDYQVIHSKKGSPDTFVVRSDVSDPRFQNLTGNDIVFFRPSLTPYSMFCNNPTSFLVNESPQAVNSALSVALHLEPRSIILVGVDLGGRSTGNERVSGALGRSERNMRDKHPGNLSESVFTEPGMLDAKENLQRLVEYHRKVRNLDTILFNASDGILIDAFKPIHLSEYLNTYEETVAKDKPLCSVKESKSKIASWRKSLNTYDIKMLRSTWASADPRRIVRTTIQQSIDLLQRESCLDSIGIEVNKLVSNNGRHRYETFTIRVIRGYLVKSLVSTKRQLLIMQSANIDEETMSVFRSQSLSEICEGLLDIEVELYSLCDQLDKLLASN